MNKNIPFFPLLVCFLMVTQFMACKKEIPVELPTETSIEVTPQTNISEPVCYNQEIFYGLKLASKDLVGLTSLEIIRNNNDQLFYYTDLDDEMTLNWFYQTREEDINNQVQLAFILTDVTGKEVTQLSGFDVIEDFNFLSDAFSINTAFDLKFNQAINIGNANSDLILATETESCGNNCETHKHTIYAENGVEMYSFPDDFYYSVDHRALKEQEIRDAIEQKEPLSQIVAYTSFESELDDNQLYINNTPLIFLIGENKDLCIFQIADPVGLWRYKKKEIFTGQ